MTRSRGHGRWVSMAHPNERAMFTEIARMSGNDRATESTRSHVTGPPWLPDLMQARLNAIQHATFDLVCRLVLSDAESEK